MITKRALLALAAVCASFTAVSAPVSDGVVQAYCSGSTMYTATLKNSSGTTLATEKAVSGTCNHNYTYTGTVYNATGNGLCAYVYVTGIYNPGQYGCSTFSSDQFSYSDGNSSASFNLCVDAPGSPTCKSAITNSGF